MATRKRIVVTNDATPSNGQLPIGNGTDYTVASLTAGTGVTISPGAGSITINATGSVVWTEITGATQTIAVNNGYVANRATSITFTLPTTSAVGDVFRIGGKGAGLFIIAQNANQVMHVGNTDSTVGAGGSVTATHKYDAIECVCIVANLEWLMISSVGAGFTIV